MSVEFLRSIEETENAQFFACGTDNGKNKEAPLDNFYVECTDGCGYNTAVRIMDDSNDIDVGSIHLHDAIVDPTTGSESSAPESGGGSAPREGTEQGGTTSEPEGSPDVVTLEPKLLSTVPAGTPMVVTAMVEAHGNVIDGTPVTLRWTNGNGLRGETTGLANAYGIVAFAVTVPAGDVEYTAWTGELESNGVRITGF